MGVLECEKRSAKTGFLIVVGTLKKGRIQTIKPARCGLYFNSGSGGWMVMRLKIITHFFCAKLY